MTMNMYSSDSLQYLLTKWFEAVTTKHTQYTELLTDHIEISTKKVLDIALELEKMQNKVVTQEALAKKAELINNLSENEAANIEFIEFIYSYKTLINEIEGFNVDLSSRKKILKLIKSEIDFHDNLAISLRNLVKSINAVFRSDSKPKKKNIEEFESFLKDYSRLLRNLKRGFTSFTAEFQDVIDALKDEVEQAKKIDEEYIE
ncbi:MAG: hypothetical protein ACTSO5_14495 [Candidatus Heimdallarchaeaceae archaeon]